MSPQTGRPYPGDVDLNRDPRFLEVADDIRCKDVSFKVTHLGYLNLQWKSGDFRCCNESVLLFLSKPT